MTSSEITVALRDGQSLDAAAVETAAAFLLDAGAETELKADLLRALSKKGETAGEIAAFVKVFLKHAVRPLLDAAALGRPVMDVCGTGGDKLNLFNISTASMFVLAGGGVVVVKHGNRGITSQSGGADVLEALGVAVNLTPEQFAACVTDHGAGFMLAPQYHPAFKAVAPVRAQLAGEGVRTIFNLIGPLLNPVQPPMQMVGVYDPALPPVYAEIMRELGRARAWAVHGTVPGGSGMDEVSILGPTRVVALSGGEIGETTETVPLPVPAIEELKGGDAKTNAGIIQGILSREIRGAKRDIVLANAAAGFRVAGVCDSWPEAIARAEESLDSGRAKEVLDKLRAFSNT
ncbi:MAG TPA: anthranilate phosphoribosyltransferase [Verrucomicrobiales bacterium]|nr:anthranilate phosphoribosyltransferase [Verrucomicrobiales bacterium]